MHKVVVQFPANGLLPLTLGKVIMSGQDANLSQVQAGLAWHYKQYEKEQLPADRSSYAQAEVDAKIRKIGLWHDAVQFPPWDFRHGVGNSAEPLRSLPEKDSSCKDQLICIGLKGGQYCITDGGRKKYL